MMFQLFGIMLSITLGMYLIAWGIKKIIALFTK